MRLNDPESEASLGFRVRCCLSEKKARRKEESARKRWKRGRKWASGKEGETGKEAEF